MSDRNLSGLTALFLEAQRVLCAVEDEMLKTQLGHGPGAGLR